MLHQAGDAEKHSLGQPAVDIRRAGAFGQARSQISRIPLAIAGPERQHFDILTKLDQAPALLSHEGFRCEWKRAGDDQNVQWLVHVP